MVISWFTQGLFSDLIAACSRLLAATTCIGNAAIAFNNIEPAINVYTTGGDFKRHKDEQSLTVLVPLCNASTFGGGGTAFWSADTTMSAADTPPTMVLAPACGSAIIFTGEVLHAGLPVLSGQRCVFVASFSPAEHTPCSQQNKNTGWRQTEVSYDST